MARTKRSAKLDTWNAHKRLKTALMHQERINNGQYIAYRRPSGSYVTYAFKKLFLI